MQNFLHYFLHFGAPFLIALWFFKKSWKFSYLLLLATMVVDLDHLWANPIFLPNRCSIGFHPLHSYYAIGVYFLLLFFKNPIIFLIGLGLVLHMATDFLDCVFTYSTCASCLDGNPSQFFIRLLFQK